MDGAVVNEHGANIEAQNDVGNTALIWASRKGRDAHVKFLLEHGANIEGQDKNNNTALMCASMEGHDTVVKLLLEHGAQVEARDDAGKTALIGASLNCHLAVVKVLLERGADIGTQDNDQETALILTSEKAAFWLKKAKIGASEWAAYFKTEAEISTRRMGKQEVGCICRDGRASNGDSTSVNRLPEL